MIDERQFAQNGIAEEFPFGFNGNANFRLGKQWRNNIIFDGLKMNYYYLEILCQEINSQNDGVRSFY